MTITDNFLQGYEDWESGGTYKRPYYMAVGAGNMSLDTLSYGFDFTDSRFQIYEVDSHVAYTYKSTGLEVVNTNGESDEAIYVHSGAKYRFSSGTLRLGASLVTDHDAAVGLSLIFASEINMSALYQPDIHKDWDYIELRYTPGSLKVISREWPAAEVELADITVATNTTIFDVSVTFTGATFTVTYLGGTETAAFDNIIEDGAYILVYANPSPVSGSKIILNNLTTELVESTKPWTGWLEAEIDREVVSTTSVQSTNIARLATRFGAKRGTGLWREMALFDEPAIATLLDEADKDTGWTSGSGNDLSLEVYNHARGAAALFASGTGGLRFTKSTMLGATGDADDFSSIDTAYWDIYYEGTEGLASIVGNRLKLYSPGTSYVNKVMLVSDQKVDMDNSEFFFKIDEMTSNLVWVGITNTPRPKVGDTYQFLFVQGDDLGSGLVENTITVRKKVGITWTILDSTPYTMPFAGYARIKTIGTGASRHIYFYYDETLVYDEVYTIGTGDMHIEIGSTGNGYAFISAFGSTFNSVYSSGTAPYGMFPLSTSPIASSPQTRFQFHYKPYTVALAEFATDRNLVVRLGNDASNYWRWDYDAAALYVSELNPASYDPIIGTQLISNEWNWLSSAFGACTAVVGTPVFNALLRYFYLGYETKAGVLVTLATVFEDAIDYLRIFKDNGTILGHSEFPNPIPKGTMEARNLVWTITINREDDS